MTKKDTLIKEISFISDETVEKILSYIENIKKQSYITETMIQSESSLAKDWFSQEEDEAWKDL